MLHDMVAHIYGILPIQHEVACMVVYGGHEHVLDAKPQFAQILHAADLSSQSLSHDKLCEGNLRIHLEQLSVKTLRSLLIHP